MTARTIVGLLTAVMLVLGLAACDGEHTPERPMPDLDSTPDLGPVEQLVQDAYAGYDEGAARVTRMRAQELVAQCMADEGFTYTPVDSDAAGTEIAMPTTDDGETLVYGTLPYAEAYGYGITTNPWADSAVPGQSPTAQAWIDPDQEYLESMSESEMAAYEVALNGVQPDFTEEEDWESWNPTWEERGCYGFANHEVYGDAMGDANGGNDWAELEAEIESMWASIDTDPRVAHAVEDWASCMADAGYQGMGSIDDGEDLISEKVDAVYEDDPYAELGDDASAQDREAADAAVQDRLAAITPEEVEVAVADFTCRDETDYRRIRAAVSVDLQQVFYDAHTTELEAYAESMSSSLR